MLYFLLVLSSCTPEFIVIKKEKDPPPTCTVVTTQIKDVTVMEYRMREEVVIPNVYNVLLPPPPIFKAE